MKQELEQAAGEFAAKAAPMTAEDACFNAFRIIALRELLTRAFKAGAEWRLEQMKADWQRILVNMLEHSKHGLTGNEAACPQFYQGQIELITHLQTWIKEYQKKLL